ncbi:MAG: hypothetical protein NTX65_12625 [Ignavibacteriales bacterium]|nr:hypothetical protein [Ignavibacteriales bacterium]
MKKGFKIFIGYNEKKNEEDAVLSLEIVLMFTSMLQKQLNLLNEKLLTCIKEEESNYENITHTLNVIEHNIDRIKHTLFCLATGVSISIKSFENLIEEVSSHQRVVENILKNLGNN